jgi:transcription initiation factor TFIIF subunit alpha
MQEYTVRVPTETSKKYHVMRFSASNNVDVTKWKNVKLDRENTIQSGRYGDEEQPKFGAGSEFGREARDEARRRKYARYAKKLEDQPWILNVKSAKVANTPGKTNRKFKGLREGGVTDNTSYYVFFQAHDGAFEAFPISEWYNFTPIPRYKALTAEEAEEQFEKRDKILNYFTVMATKKKNELNAANDSFLDEGVKLKKGKDFKVSDMDDWGELEMSGGSDRESDEGRGAKDKKKGKIRKKSKKRESDEEEDSEPLEESDEGDFDTREVDYMSDSSSNSDDDVERLNRELKGVEDEDALRKLVLSDDEEEEENGEANKDKDGETTANADSAEGAAEKAKPQEADPKIKVKKEKTSSGPSSEESEDSDFDDTKYQSAMFMQKSEREAAAALAAESRSAAQKRKLETPESNPGLSGKKAKMTAETGVTEEAVKRYLMRKPITTTELLQKFKSKKIPISGNDLVATIAQILKKLNPEKQKIKDKLYLYIKPK